MGLNTGTILVREGDRKRFRVSILGHWSIIKALDSEEEDRIKWVGDHRWVSDNRGHTYVLEPAPK